MRWCQPGGQSRPKRIDIGHPRTGPRGTVKQGVRPRRTRQGFLAREGRPMRAALYARVSTHDQQTLGIQVEAMAAYIKDRGWDAGEAGRGRRLGREGPGRPRVVAEGGPPPRDRCRRGLASGPLGPVAARPGGDAPRADRTGRRLRIPHRGAGPHHADRPCDGRDAGGLRRVRARDPPRAGPGRDRPGAEGGPSPRPPADGVTEGGRRCTGSRPSG